MCFVLVYMIAFNINEGINNKRRLKVNKEKKIAALLVKLHQAQEQGAQMINARTEALINEAHALGILDFGDTITSRISGEVLINAKDGEVQIPTMRKKEDLSIIHHYRNKPAHQ